MKLLDRYLLRHFLLSYLLSGIMFLFFWCLVDFLFFLDRFIEKEANFYDVFSFYGFSMPSLFLNLSPIAILIGVWFSIGHLAEDREIMAMRLCGISTFRIITPLLLVAMVISLLLMAINLKIVPYCEGRREEIWKGKIHRQAEYMYKKRQNFVFTSRGAIYFTKEFNKKEGKMKDVQIVNKNGSEGGEVRIFSHKAIWQDGKWALIDGIEQIFDRDGNLKSARKFEREEISLILSPHELWLYNRPPSLIPTSKIKAYLLEYRKNSPLFYKYSTELHSRFSLPFINLTLLLLSIPFCILSLHQSTVGRIGWALGLFFLYYVFFSFMVMVGEKGILPPPFSVWLPNIIFLTVGILYLWKKR